MLPFIDAPENAQAGINKPFLVLPKFPWPTGAGASQHSGWLSGCHPETLLHFSQYLSLFPVGLMAQIPQKAAGKRRLPPTSVPMPKMDPPPPTSAPSPPEEPPGVLV